jgi:hypothetical protein
MQESAGALQDVARQPRYLGGALGLLGVLHTWTRQLRYHPHVHYLVPGVALCDDGSLCFPKNPAFLLPVARVSARLRNRCAQRLRREAQELFRQIPPSAWRKHWVVHCQAAGRGPEALGYLSRYIYKTAISGTRLLDQDDESVTFCYRDSATGENHSCRLSAECFLQRFLQHVLPKGFHRVRHSGWLSPAAHRHFAHVAALLAAFVASIPSNYAPSVVILCPYCAKPMRYIAHIPRAPP